MKGLEVTEKNSETMLSIMLFFIILLLCGTEGDEMHPPRSSVDTMPLHR